MGFNTLLLLPLFDGLNVISYLMMSLFLFYYTDDEQL